MVPPDSVEAVQDRSISNGPTAVAPDSPAHSASGRASTLKNHLHDPQPRGTQGAVAL